MKAWKAITVSLWLSFLYGYSSKDPLEALTERIQKKLPALPGMLGPDYDSLYPYYVKYCSVTKLSPMPEKGTPGGIPGHAVFYLKGVCPDKTLGPSGLSLCPEESDFSDPELGVGLSVDRYLKNANFFVFPTRNLFISAELEPGEPFTETARNRMIDTVLNQNLFQGLEFHDEAFPKDLPDNERERFMVDFAFGTDFGIGMARNLYCINVPVPRPIMGLIVGYLNQLNSSYEHSKGVSYRGTTKTDSAFHWDGLWDNCTHTPINAMAAVGILETRRTNLPFFQQLSQLAIPSHTFLEIHDALNVLPIDVDSIYEHPVRRQMFQDYEWIPLQDGTISEFIQMYHPNEYYEEDDLMYVAPNFARNLGKDIREVCNEPKYSYHGKGKLGYVPHMFFSYKRIRTALENLLKKELSSEFEKQRELSNKVIISVLEHTLNDFGKRLSQHPPHSSDGKHLKNQLESVEKDLNLRKKALDCVEFVEKFKKFLQQKMFLLELRMANFVTEL